MTSQHKERPGSGVMFYEEPAKRKHEKAPDYKGFVILEMDYKAGEKLKLSAWQKPTSMGYNLLSLQEDNWSKRKEEERNAPKEVQPSYHRNHASTYDRPVLNASERAIRHGRDDDVPF